MVVALVPTLDANYCSIDIKGKVPRPRDEADLRQRTDRGERRHGRRSLTSLLFVLALVLVLVAAFGVKRYRRVFERTEPTGGYAVAWVDGPGWSHLLPVCTRFRNPDMPSTTSAQQIGKLIAVGLIILAAVLAAIQRLGATTRPRRGDPDLRLVAFAMLLAAGVIRIGDHFSLFSGWVDAPRPSCWNCDPHRSHSVSSGRSRRTTGRVQAPPRTTDCWAQSHPVMTRPAGHPPHLDSRTLAAVLTFAPTNVRAEPVTRQTRSGDPRPACR